MAVRGGKLSDADLAGVYEDFARLYEGFYGYRLDGIPIELVRLQVVIAGEELRLPEPAQADGAGGEEAAREVWFPGHGFVETPVVRREAIPTGTRRDGPLVVEEMDSTIVVPPHWRLASERGSVLELERKGA